MLTLVNRHFEVAVFTASQKLYADVILDYIDPTGELIQHRLYRDSCIKNNDNNIYLKDLRIIRNVPMKNKVLVDNAVYCFGQHLSNGVPITPFKEDKSDREFISLMRFLIRIGSMDDIRVALSDAFSFEDMANKEKYNFSSFIKYYE